MTVKLNKDNGLQTRWTRTPAGNSVLPQLAVKCKIEAEFSNQHLCRLTVKCSEIANCGNTQNVRLNSLGKDSV